MISLGKAQQLLFRHIPLLRKERVDLGAASGRVLAADVLAREDAPSFDKVFMDGFAVRASDACRACKVLKLVGRSLAGERDRPRVGPGECVQVATGSFLPRGADAVVPVEMARRFPPDTVKVSERVRRWDNIYRKGVEIKRGTRLLCRGDVLTPLRVALLVSQGIRKIDVFRSPSVTVLATGREIVASDRPKRSGEIFNATTPMLVEALRGMGIEPMVLGVVGDEERSLERSLRRGLKADVLIVTGAVSVGEKDLVPRLLKRIRVRTLFHRVRIRPGKPVLVGTFGSRLVFGLPGNPLSTWITWLLFARPVLRKMSGFGKESFQEGVLTKSVVNRSGRDSFLPAFLSREKGVVRVSPLPWVGSADLAAAGRAQAFFKVKAEGRRFPKGARVPFLKVV